MPRLGLAILVAVGLVHSTAAQEETAWVEIRSPHFTLLSDAGEASGKRVLKEFELIRAAFRRSFPAISRDPQQPVVIYALAKQSGMAELLPEIWEDSERAKPVGLYRSGPIAHHIALRLDINSERPFETIYHEYFHALADANLGELPLWLGEGLATYWQATEIFSKEMRVGGANLSHLAVLESSPLLPLTTLFAADRDSPYYREQDKASVFYAQSWALVHLLLNQDGDGLKKIATYVSEARQSGNGRDAAEQAFGSLVALESALRAHLRSGRLAPRLLERPRGIADEQLEARSLSKAETLSLKAAFLGFGEHPERARDLLDSALAEAPELALAHETLGFLALARGQSQAAIGAFAEAVSLGSKNHLTHYYYALACLEEKKPVSEAQAALVTAAELEPGFLPAHLLIAELSAEWGTRVEDGLASAKRAVDLSPRLPAARRLLGAVLLASGDVEAAATAYESAVALGPPSAALFAELANAFSAAGKNAEAAATFERALELSPQNAWLRRSLAMELAAIERHAEATEQFAAIEEAMGEDSELFYAYATSLAAIDALDRADAAFAKAETYDPYDAGIAADRSRVLERLDRLDAAIDALERAIENEPEVANYHDRIAALFERAGRSQLAEKHRREAERLRR